MHLRAPRLTVEQEKVQSGRDTASVQVVVHNRGDQTSAATVEGWFERAGDREAVAAQFLRDLTGGASVPLSFPVPPRFRDSKPFRFHLSVAGALWPTHRWTRTLDLRVVPPWWLYGGATLLGLVLLAGVLVQRLYGDPIVVQVGRSVGALVTFPLLALPAADRKLRRVRRLKEALAAVGLPAERWVRAVAAAQSPGGRRKRLRRCAGR